MNGFPNYGSYFNPFASPQYMNNNMMQMPQQQISNMQAQQMQQQPQMFNNQNMALNQLNGKIVEKKAIYYCSVVEEREDSKNKETSMDGKMITTDVIK